jgi:threonine dehydratase
MSHELLTSVAPMNSTPPTIDDAEKANARLEGRIVRTPLLEAEAAGNLLGRRVLVKAEVLQRTGSFKFRGGLAFLDRLDPEARARGVVAFSSGNHGQGAAAAAAAYGVPATVVMPADAPAIKAARTRAWGAEVVLYDRATDDREAMAAAIADERGMAVLPPYDHPWVIAGQASIGLEIAEQCARLGVEDPTVLVPAGGGGLCAGTALTLADRMPGARVVAVEPVGWDDHGLSLRAGERTPAPQTGSGLCDSLLAHIPGEMTFALNSRLLAGAIAVDDTEVRAAMRHAFEQLKLVVEPGGAVGLAAALAGRVGGDGPLVAVLSGGNVDGTLFAEIVTGTD